MGSTTRTARAGGATIPVPQPGLRAHPPRTGAGHEGQRDHVTFVTDGIEAALERARKEVGGKDVLVAGGAETIQQYLAAGLIDEFRGPSLRRSCSGRNPLFGDLGANPPRVELTRALSSPGAAHLRYRVLRTPVPAARHLLRARTSRTALPGPAQRPGAAPARPISPAHFSREFSADLRRDTAPVPADAAARARSPRCETPTAPSPRSASRSASTASGRSRPPSAHVRRLAHCLPRRAPARGHPRPRPDLRAPRSSAAADSSFREDGGRPRG